jgi:hypothetical protein
MSKHHHFSTHEFTALRARAKDKRDKGVAILNTEHQANLRAIAQLEQDLYGSQSSRHKKVSECVKQVIPRATPSTTASPASLILIRLTH